MSPVIRSTVHDPMSDGAQLGEQPMLFDDRKQSAQCCFEIGKRSGVYDRLAGAIDGANQAIDQSDALHLH